MAEKIVVREALTLEGIVYVPGWEIPFEVWMRLPVKERNMLLNTARFSSAMIRKQVRYCHLRNMAADSN